MRRPRRVLCIMDLSLTGRAGLAVVLPVLSACGVQACPLPASLFSTHTGGFGEVEKRSEEEFCAAALAHYARENVTFDAVYTGYLTGRQQYALAEAAFAQYPAAFRVVDPAMGDNGRLYTGMSPETMDHMRALCEKAHLITPNYTESALLLDEEAHMQPLPEAAMAERLAHLAGTGRSVVITSAPAIMGGFETRGCGPKGENCYSIPSRHVPVQYPGTGDIFTAALVGLFLRQERPDIRAAATQAVEFVERAVHLTHEGGGDPRQGLWFEPLLHTLGDEI